VNRVDSLLAKQSHEPLQATRVDGPSHAKYLRRNSRAAKKVAEPTDAVSGTDWNDCMPSLPEFLGETKDHHLCSTGAV